MRLTDLGDGLGTLRDSVLSQFTGKDQSHSSLDLTGGDGGLLGVRSKFYRCARVIRTGTRSEDTRTKLT